MRSSGILLVMGGLVSIWIQADPGVIWIIGFFATSILISLFVLWVWNFLKTESMLRKTYRFQFNDGQ